MKKGIIISIIVIAVLVIGVLAFIFSQQPSSNNPTTPLNTQSNEISIKGFAFSPSTISIKVGDTLTWTNQDSTSHTVTSDSGSELSSATLSQGQTYSHTFNTAGTYSYHCTFHSGMKAKVIVS